MEQNRSRLLLKNFDGTLRTLRLTPKGSRSRLTLDMDDYETENGIRTRATLVFEHTVSIDFEVNLFDESTGCALFGLYEIFDPERKRALLERVFLSRRENYLYHGDYHYDPHEENDLLNRREPLEDVLADTERWHLYQQQTQGGVYTILAESMQLLPRQTRK